MEVNIPSSLTTIRFLELTLLALAAVGACGAALFTWRAARATAKANRGQTILMCLDKYISIMRDKSEAIKAKEERLAKDFYRELFDLHWSEFHLWHEGAIPNSVMSPWIIVRRRNFNKDYIECRSEGNNIQISYASSWSELKGEYFELTDSFVNFMDTIHIGDIVNIRKLKRKTKRNKQ